MESIELLDRKFELFIPESKIQVAIDAMAELMNEELKDKDPLFICILNGSFMFAADLMKRITFPCQISFVKLASYQGTQSTGKITELIGLNIDIKDKTVVLLEDIIDTGLTIKQLVSQLKGYEPAQLKIASLLHKPEACEHEVNIDYVGLALPEKFIVGYGLDYNGYGRNLKNIYSVLE